MRTSLLPSLLLVVLTALAFWPARTASFLLYDDPMHVTENPYILPPSPARLTYFWRYPFDRTPIPGIPSTIGQVGPPYQSIYAPLAFTMWGLLVYPAHMASQSSNPSTQNAAKDQLTLSKPEFSLDPSIYHSFNVGLHVLNVLLVFALLRQFVKSQWAAALGAALFAVHPVQVEPVAWVTGMNNLLSGFFALLALLLYLKSKDESEGARWRIGTYWGSVLCFLLSVLSKPSSVTLPLLALLLCFGLGEKKWRTRLLEMIPWSAVAFFCLITNQIVSRGSDNGVPPMLWQRPFLVGDALTFYATKLVFPFNLAPDYGRRPEWVMQQPLTYVLWLLPVAATVFVWLWWRRSAQKQQDNYVARIALTAWAVFVIVLLPSSGIVSYYFHLISIVSDRYMYLALLGPALLVTVLASRGLESPKVSLRHFLIVIAPGLVTGATALTIQQTKFWSSDALLWTHNIEINPQSTVAYFQYGSALYNQGDYQAAIPVLEKGVQVTPRSWLIETALGDSYFQTNQPIKAASHYRRALEIWPNAVYAHLGLGVVFAQQGKVAEAIGQFGQGLQLQPQNPLLLGYMGLNMMEAGKSAEGAVYLRNALKNGFTPGKGHFYLGNALAREGNIAAAANEWLAAVQADPNYYEAYFNLGIAYAGSGNAAQAIQYFQRTVQLQPDYAPAQVQLGLQWQKQGQGAKAKAAFRAALRSDPQNALALKALRSKN